MRIERERRPGSGRRARRGARPEHRARPTGSGSAGHRHPILTGYDGSNASRHALAYAAGMARRLDRWLVVVHVWRRNGVAFVPLTERMRWLRTELADADLTGLDIEMIVRPGDPARELRSITTERNADAIVIGAPGAVAAPVRRIGARLAGQACAMPGGDRAVKSHNGTLNRGSPPRPVGDRPARSE